MIISSSQMAGPIGVGNGVNDMVGVIDIVGVMVGVKV